MDREGIDSIIGLLQVVLERRWPRFEFTVETAFTPSSKRIQVKTVTQVSLDEYFGDYEDMRKIPTGYCCFYITIHPSKLTKEEIQNTFIIIEKDIIKQEIIFESTE